MEELNTPFLFVITDDNIAEIIFESQMKDEDEEEDGFYWNIYEVLEEMYTEEVEKEKTKNTKAKKDKAYEEAMKAI